MVNNKQPYHEKVKCVESLLKLGNIQAERNERNEARQTHQVIMNYIKDDNELTKNYYVKAHDLLFYKIMPLFDYD